MIISTFIVKFGVFDEYIIFYGSASSLYFNSYENIFPVTNLIKRVPLGTKTFNITTSSLILAEKLTSVVTNLKIIELKRYRY